MNKVVNSLLVKGRQSLEFHPSKLKRLGKHSNLRVNATGTLQKNPIPGPRDVLVKADLSGE